MNDSDDIRRILYDFVYDHIVAHGKATNAGRKIVADSARVWEAFENVASVRDLPKLVYRRIAAAFSADVLEYREEVVASISGYAQRVHELRFLCRSCIRLRNYGVSQIVTGSVFLVFSTIHPFNARGHHPTQVLHIPSGELVLG
jgi:hypothetical protein